MRGGVVVLMIVLAAQVAHADMVITKVGVKVAPAKPNGDAWDSGLGKAPDPRIEIRVAGERVRECPPVKDSLEAECAVGNQRTYAGELEIELRVSDRDIASDDAIGNAHGQLPEDSHGRFELASAGGVERAWVEVEEVEGPSVLSRIRAHIGARSLGALVGVLLTLLAYGLFGARLLSPPDERRASPAGEDDAREGIYVHFWRSPILLASAGASILGIVLANILRDPTLPIAVGAIPYALGGVGFAAPILDAYKQQHLGGKRLRLVIAGIAAMFAVPVYDFTRELFTGVSFLLTHLGWLFVVIVLLVCFA